MEDRDDDVSRELAYTMICRQKGPPDKGREKTKNGDAAVVLFTNKASGNDYAQPPHDYDPHAEQPSVFFPTSESRPRNHGQRRGTGSVGKIRL